MPVQTHGRDEHTRTIGDVILPDGINLNHELVRQGLCWWYRKYAPGDTVLEHLEVEALESKKGLWVDPVPIPPWVYRKARRGKAVDLSDLVPLDVSSSGLVRLSSSRIQLPSCQPHFGHSGNSHLSP